MRRFVLNMAICIAALIGNLPLQAQSLKDLFSKENIERAVSTVAGKNTASLEGTWTFSGSAVEFESDDLLQKAGGAVAANLVESKLNEQLEKLGIKPGTLSFTFNPDSTFQTKLGTKKLSGTYSYDQASRTVELKYVKLVKLNAKANCTSQQLDLLFNADKLLDLITLLSSKTNSSVLQSVTSLADNYDGMRLGLALKKEP